MSLMKCLRKTLLVYCIWTDCFNISSTQCSWCISFRCMRCNIPECEWRLSFDRYITSR